jgi:hypothetical protein
MPSPLHTEHEGKVGANVSTDGAPEGSKVLDGPLDGDDDGKGLHPPHVAN